MIRTIALLLLSVAAILFLAGCNPTLSDIKTDAVFAKTCEDGGGHVWYNDFGIRCSYEKED